MASNETTNHIVTEYDGNVLRIRMNRPDKKNALSLAMYSAMVKALEEADANPEIRVVLFTGSPTCFTSGNDVMDFMSNPPSDEDAPVIRFLDALAGAGKPLMAAVCGTAIGLGTTMLLHCDLVVAGDNARFRMPFVNLGLCPEAASSYLLPRVVGYARAAELILLGESFGAEEALALGLVNTVGPPEEAEGLAMAKARALAAQPPAAVRAAKALMRRASEGTVLEAMRAENLCFGERLRSPEAAEAFQAFIQRRKPDFSKFS
ncbi:MAG TPA: enoyl-CoA hydratase [Candidatus Hydrogenedentes bacterium]|nr:enoyl-CoA hydratase [Candidatus Hydrogenedentota bacterium]HPG66635.1 enoyl-CoA hydratase [Candidatus Hydrogenedentota bacterium]